MFQSVFALKEFIQHDGRLHLWDVHPRLDGARGDRNHHFRGHPIRVVEKNDERLALDRVALLIFQHRLLRGFMQDHHDEPRLRPQLATGAQKR